MGRERTIRTTYVLCGNSRHYRNDVFYRFAYESEYIGKSEDYDAVVMSIEVFVGQEIEGNVVEASFDITIAEDEPGKGRLTYGPMTGPITVTQPPDPGRSGVESVPVSFC